RNPSCCRTKCGLCSHVFWTAPGPLPHFDAEVLFPDPDHVSRLQLDGLLRADAQEEAGGSLAEVDQRGRPILRDPDLRVLCREQGVASEVHVAARPADEDRGSSAMT